MKPFCTLRHSSAAKEGKPALIKRNSKYFNGNFSATGCCKNCLKTQLFLMKVTTGACRPRTPCCLLKNFLISYNKYYQYIKSVIELCNIYKSDYETLRTKQSSELFCKRGLITNFPGQFFISLTQ